jgi:hypothetical protein
MAFHFVYGLRLSANIAIPGLPILSSLDGLAEVQIRLKETTPRETSTVSSSEIFYVSRTKDATNDAPDLWAAQVADGGYFVLQYSDGTRFTVERSGKEVFADWPDRFTVEDISPYLLGPILGFILRLRGTIPLHASAVSIAGHAIALMGPAGAGKSTTAGGFARRGYRVISDDVVALRGDGAEFFIPPGYPRVNLWAESVQALFGASDSMPFISPDWDKQFMPLDQETQFESSPMPLGAIYVLQTREAGLAAPVLGNLRGPEAFLALLGNTYMNYIPDPEMRRLEFAVLHRVLGHVPIRTIRAATDSSMLFNLCETIAADAKALCSSISRKNSQPRQIENCLGVRDPA